mmetsp:Transcript_69768/g.220950  ORF Transcript_69768/g.220950 Transcript_69768/m.220950 type:complete len:230 (+) Transcript_69768:1375-2064(+)
MVTWRSCWRVYTASFPSRAVSAGDWSDAENTARCPGWRVTTCSAPAAPSSLAADPQLPPAVDVALLPFFPFFFFFPPPSASSTGSSSKCRGAGFPSLFTTFSSRTATSGSELSTREIATGTGLGFETLNSRTRCSFTPNTPKSRSVGAGEPSKAKGFGSRLCSRFPWNTCTGTLSWLTLVERRSWVVYIRSVPFAWNRSVSGGALNPAGIEIPLRNSVIWKSGSSTLAE